MAQVKLTQITKVVNGKILFEAPNLTAHTGEIVGIIGNNGAGKTTLMKIIANQDPDFDGQRLVQGSVVLVRQVNPLVDQSGGQTTITNIRTALAQHAAILILDEPTANLDEEHQDWLIGQLRHFAGLVLLISHDQHLLKQVATKIWSVSNHAYQQFDGGLTEFERLNNQNQASQFREYQR